MPELSLHPNPSGVLRTPKNIVVCCDGTGNEFGPRNSNVVRIYTALDLTDETQQVAYYHPGLGTMGAPSARNVVDKQWTRLTGLAFGAGFRDNVFDAYRFLMNSYEAGDRVFMFGFSRGAYTVRALSGLLHAYGLLRRGNEGHLPYAWRAFTQKVKEKGDEEAKGLSIEHTVIPNFSFRETYSHPDFEIHFVGLFDTVSSIGWIYSPIHLLYTAQNPLLRTVRHCVSIDERRCFFRDNLYGKPLAEPPQDIVQVWFPGVHSDVGGSYPADESFPSDTAFQWLLKEAETSGLLTEPDRINLVLGKHTTRFYRSSDLYRPAPQPGHKLHESLTGCWKLLEYIPQRYYDATQKKRLWRVPLGRPRFIPPESLIHSSAVACLNGLYTEEPPYCPPNLLSAYLQPGAVTSSPSTADLAGCSTYVSPAPTLPTPAQTRRRKTLVGIFAIIDILILLLLLAIAVFVLSSLVCGFVWVLRHSCDWIALIWRHIFSAPN